MTSTLSHELNPNELKDVLSELLKDEKKQLYEKLYRYALWLISKDKHQDAQDIVQESIVCLYETINNNNFKHGNSNSTRVEQAIISYLFTTVKNLAWKLNKDYTNASEFDDDPANNEPDPSYTIDPVINPQLSNIVKLVNKKYKRPSEWPEGLDRLVSDRRKKFTSKNKIGKSYKEIALELGVSTDLVGNTLSKTYHILDTYSKIVQIMTSFNDIPTEKELKFMQQQLKCSEELFIAATKVYKQTFMKGRGG